MWPFSKSEAPLRFRVVSSSSGNIYDLEATKDGDIVKFTCTCDAGRSGMYCKHRLSLINGDITDLQSDNSNDVSVLKKMYVGTQTEAILETLTELEKMQSGIKRDISKTKKLLSASLNGQRIVVK